MLVFSTFCLLLLEFVHGNLAKCVSVIKNAFCVSLTMLCGLRPPAGRQYGMSISQQPLNRSLPNFQQLLLMSNEGKVESFSSFAYG